MNDHFFAMLLSLFEQTLTQMKLQQKFLTQTLENDDETNDFDSVDTLAIFDHPSEWGTRVLTRLEQSKFTKPALQFLMRLMHTQMLSSEQFEHVMNIVLDAQVRFMTIEELKQIIRQVLLDSLSFKDILMLEFAYDVETSFITMH